MKETWKPVAGFEGFYEVSDRGEIRSLVGRWGKGRRLKLRPGNRGYVLADLRKPGVARMANVAKLVAEAFMGPCPEGRELCHNNGRRNDNWLENLRYDSHRNNCADRVTHGTDFRGEKSPRRKLNAEQVLRILRDPRRLREISADYGVTETQISYIKNGKQWQDVYLKAWQSCACVPSRGRGKLLPEQVLAIKHDPRTQSAIAKEYGIFPSEVSRIKSGKRYARFLKQV